MTLTVVLQNNVQWINEYGDSDNFVEAQVFSRLGQAALIPSTLISTVLDTIIGLGITLESILTSGREESINIFAKNHIIISEKILSSPFIAFVKVINPQSNIFFRSSVQRCEWLKKEAKSCVQAGGWQKHVVARLIYGSLLPLAFLASRIFDLALGVIFVPLAVITLGLENTINRFATNSLTSPGIISDFAFCARMFVNPN